MNNKISLILIGELGVPVEHLSATIGHSIGATSIINHDNIVSNELDKILACNTEEEIKSTAAELKIPESLIYSLLQMTEGYTSSSDVPSRKLKYLINFYGRSRIAHDPKYWMNKIEKSIESAPEDATIILINPKAMIEIREYMFSKDTVVMRLVLTKKMLGQFTEEQYSKKEINQAIYNDFRFFDSRDISIICDGLTLDEASEYAIRFYYEKKQEKENERS